MSRPTLPRVVVAMSGGVDSSVAAALLVEQGYEVVGVMLRLWAEGPDDFGWRISDFGFRRDGCESAIRNPQSAAGPGERANRCCSLEAVHDARAVADLLGIPFYVVNAEQQFKTDVVDYFVSEYAAGRTPNPCLRCNRLIRFGFLLRYAEALGASCLATGHYAQVRPAPGVRPAPVRPDAAGCYQLWRGADRAKDQSYALSVLGQAELAHVLFPVGDITKAQVRGLAAERGLPTASRAESQDLCFVTDGDYRRFLTEWAPEAARPGPILDRQGRRLGTHRGLPFYTIGQRSGLGIAASRPLYVLELDVEANALVVGAASDLGGDHLTTGPVNWIAGAQPEGPIPAEVQIRYHAAPAPATVTPLPDGRADVRFAGPLRDITPGQAAVFYDGDRCLGGGIIEISG